MKKIDWQLVGGFIVVWGWVGIIIALVLIRPMLAHACDSYEDCMKPGICRDYANKIIPCNASPEVSLAQINLNTRAIAYKLDEISKKLDKCKTIQAPMLADPEPGSKVWKANQK